MGDVRLRRPIEIHIERLVLEGVSPADRHRVGAAVERELARLLSERGVPPGLDMDPPTARHLRQVDGGSFQRSPVDRPQTVGARVAEGVYRGLGGGARRKP